MLVFNSAVMNFVALTQTAEGGPGKLYIENGGQLEAAGTSYPLWDVFKFKSVDERTNAYKLQSQFFN